MGNPVVAADGGFTPPGPADFDLPPIGGGHESFDFLGQSHYLGVTNPMVQLVLAAVLVFGFFFLAARRQAMVPGRLQYVGEQAYGFVRNSMGRDIIGSHDFMRFVPYLFSLFFFILLNNVFATIPFIQFPTLSRAGMVYGLAAMSWVVYNAVGIRKHGFLGYLKLQSVPAGIGGPILLLLVPLEFLSNIVVRPVTLALRLFANMLAGHLLLISFAVLSTALWESTKIGAIAPFALLVALTGFEILVAGLQAYIFTILTAVYIGGAQHPEH
jgi:F-type H+-transporting ATPase subunit a